VVQTETREPKRIRVVFEILATLAMLTAASVLVWENWPKPESAAATPPRTPNRPVSLGFAPMIGADTARVAILVFSEFQCPFCRALAAGALQNIQKTYVATGKVRVAFRHFPLAKHQLARSAAAASICAGNKFWEMHDLLFENQDKLSAADIGRFAAQIKLDAGLFDACRTSPKTEAQIDSDIDDARALRVSGTPTIYIGVIQPSGKLQVTDVLVGAHPFGDFRAIFERLLSKVAVQ
jgi:protein-disulfide isomerase